jgi:hypothetical protein
VRGPPAAPGTPGARTGECWAVRTGEKDRANYRHKVADTLSHLALIDRELGRHDEACKEGEEAVKIFSEMALDLEIRAGDELCALGCGDRASPLRLMARSERWRQSSM